MKKKMLTFSLAAVMLAGSVFSVSAAGVKDVLSSDYYAGKYSDLKAAYGSDKDAYVAHFLTSGAKEGRVMNPILDVVAYRNAYADLNAAFGDDWDAYVNHYLTAGIKEGRVTGVMFNLVDYAEKNPDLKAAYGDDYVALAYQYVTAGIKEGREGGSMVEDVEEEETPSVSNSGNSGSDDTQKPADPTQKPADPTQKPADPTEEPADPTQKPADPNHTHDQNTKNATKIGSVPAVGCTTDGYEVWRCKEYLEIDGKWVRCDYTWTTPIKAEHSPVESNYNTYLVHPTCTTAGVIAYTCATCGQAIEKTIDPLGHDMPEKATDKIVEQKLSTSCKEEDRGYVTTESTKTCQRAGCDYTEKATTTKKADPLPHNYSKLATKEEATCTKPGVDSGYCSVCGTEISVVTKPTDHKPADLKKVDDVWADNYLEGDPNPTHVHYSLTYCTKCGAITEVSEPGEKEACTKGTDGACTGCGLPVDRNVKSQVKFYRVGEPYIGNVQ